MNFATYDPTQGHFRTAAALELEAANEQDWEDSIFDYVTHGTVSAVTSAAVGFANTGIALGDALGIADQESYLDEEETISSLFGESTAGFYRRHKQGIDVVGMVAGSFVPGLGAVRAFRAAQVAGKLPWITAAQTGLKNPDVVLGSKALKAAKESAFLTNVAGIKNAQMRSAYAAGVGQQFLEAAVFDIALVATMNQNTALNPDDLGYFESAKNIFVDSVPYTLAGGALGGGLEILRIKGQVKKYLGDEAVRTAKYATPIIEGMTGYTPGDRFVVLAEHLKERLELGKEVAKLEDANITKSFDTGNNVIKAHILDAIEELAPKSKDITESLRALVNDIEKTGDVSKLAETVSGLTSASRTTMADMNKMTNFYDKTAPATAVMEADNIPALQNAYESLKDEVTVAYNKILGDRKFTANLIEALSGRAARIGSEEIFDSSGFAIAQPSGNRSYNVLNSSGESVLELLPVRNETTGQVSALLPRTIGLNTALIESGYEASVRLNKALGLETPFKSADDYRNFVFLHELGHVRTNGPKAMMRLHDAMFTGKQGAKLQPVVRQLLQASQQVRTTNWVQAFGKNLNEATEKVMDVMRTGAYQDLDDMQRYLGSIPEILADSAAYFTREATRQIAAKKYPELAAYFNKYGNIMKSWNDSEAFYNLKSGEVQASALLGVSDIARDGKKLRVKPAKGGSLTMHVPEMERTFKYSDKSTGDMFRGILDGVRKRSLEYTDFDGIWHLVNRAEMSKLIPKIPDNGILRIDADNLPLLERLVVSSETPLNSYEELLRDSVNSVDLIGADGKVLRNASMLDIENHILQKKQDLRMVMSTQDANRQASNPFIEKVLNVDADAAMGVSTGNRMLYRTKDFTTPDWAKFQYKHRTPADYSGAAVTYTAANHRRQVVSEVREEAAAQLLGDAYKLLEDAPHETLPGINVGESRTTLLTAARPDFGSFREFASQVGKIVNQKKLEIINNTDLDFEKFHSKFNQPENLAIRKELANVDNIARRQWYYPVRYVDETGTEKFGMVSKKFVSEFNQVAEEGMGIDPAYLRGGQLDDAVISELNAAKNGSQIKDSDYIELSKDVGEFLVSHVSRNRDIAAKKSVLAEAKGRTAMYDADAIYPPPRDLRNEKYFAFVAPKAALRGADPRKFMIFASSEAEFNAKKSIMQEKYGDAYQLFTKEDGEQFKKLVGEYDQDLVFDELHFDTSMARQGKASDFLPNLDLQSSSTLDRYRLWTIRQREALLRSGVELKYDREIQYLKGLDKQYGELGRNALAKKYREPDSIWKDTVNTMLDVRSYGGAAEDLYVKVNDFVGEFGSKIIDGALTTLRPSRQSVEITNEMMEAYNKKLEDAGIYSPTRNAVEALATSPNITKDRTFNNMVRTISNLTGTFMLRLDHAHSWMQTLSTPILAMPVLKELQQTLKGTERGNALLNATSVVQPATGLREPSAAKLYADGFQKFFTDEGKEFMAELKKRNIISDHLAQYLDVLDFSAFNGSHNISKLRKKLDDLTEFGSTFSGFKLSEQLSRFQVAWATKRIAEIGGLDKAQMYPLINSAIDKVHGVYLGTQRIQLFQGPVGQSIGMFQTYFFNYMQNMAKWIADGNKKSLAMNMGLQSSLFGVQSLPGFKQLNEMIGETTNGNLDLYSVSDANDPNSMSAYFMYGLGSHSLGVPIDFYSRGDLAIRHSTVIPTSLRDLPAVKIISDSVGNALNTLDNLGEVPAKEAILHGLAHNGFNRPLQGVGTILQNQVTSGGAMPNYDQTTIANDNIKWGSVFARLLGAKPLDESITMNAYYRDVGYQANYRKKLDSMGEKIRLNLRSGEASGHTYKSFLEEYVEIGGEAQNFNAYWTRQLRNSQRPVMEEFRKEMAQNTLYDQMIQQQKLSKPWEDNVVYPSGEAQP